MANDCAVITGGSGFLGAEVAAVLVARGYRVGIADSLQAHDRAKALATKLGGDKVAIALAGDASNAKTWGDWMAQIQDAFGVAPSHAALIAGGWKGGGLEANDEAWSAMIASNLETAHASLRALLPAMSANKRGSIVLVGSRNVERPWDGGGAIGYTVAKSGAVALVKAAAAHVLESGVRVNAVLPSTMDTPANRSAMPQADASRWVSLASVAGVIAFLLSDDARDVSGTALPVYGRA